MYTRGPDKSLVRGKAVQSFVKTRSGFESVVQLSFSGFTPAFSFHARIDSGFDRWREKMSASVDTLVYRALVV